MLDLGTLKIGIEVDDGKAKQGLNSISGEMDKTGKKTEGLGTKVKGFIKAFAAAYAVKEIVKIGKAALDAYSQYEQLSGGVEKLFGKDSAKTVSKYADEAYKTAGISANKYMELTTSFSASLLQSLGGDTDKAAKYADRAIKDMSDNANVFGTSMEEVQNAYKGFAKGNYTMLDNLKLGYGGTKTEMERLLSDAEKLTGIHYDIANFDDVIQAIHVIQKEQGITGTTAKEASKTIEGSVNMAKAAWENFLTSLGSGDGAKISKTLGDLFSSIGTVAKNVIPVVMKIVDGLISSVFELIPKLFNSKSGGLIAKILKWVSTLPAKIMKGLTSAINGIAKGIDKMSSKGMANTGVSFIKNIIVGILKALPQLLLALGRLALALIKQLPSLFKNVGTGIMKAIVEGIKSALGIVGKAFATVLKPSKIATDAIDTVKKSWDKVIKQPAKKVYQMAQQKFDEVKNKARDVFNQWKTNLGQKASKAYSVAKSGFESFVSSAKSVYGRWKDVLGQSAKKTFEVAKKGFDGVLSSMKSIYSKWKDILGQKSTKTFTTIKETITKAISGGSSGSKKKKKKKRIGLREVPYDGYEAELHKGETILTAAETNQYRKWLNNQVQMKSEPQQMMVSSSNIDYDKLAQTMINALSGMNINTAVNVNGKQIAQATAPFMRTEINTLERRANRAVGVV